jgi:proteasome lid subunit RPN8/RPN11
MKEESLVVTTEEMDRLLTRCREVRRGDTVVGATVEENSDKELKWKAPASGVVFDVSGSVVVELAGGECAWVEPHDWVGVEELPATLYTELNDPEPPGAYEGVLEWREKEQEEIENILQKTKKKDWRDKTKLVLGEMGPAPRRKVERTKEPVKVKVGRRILKLDGEGTLYREVRSFGASVVVPVGEDWADRFLGEIRVLKPTIEVEPSPEFRVPREVLEQWGRALLDAPGEALAAYGCREVDGKKEWLAVVPKQECSAGGVDVDDWEPAVTTLMGRGYRRLGTIHTHPGGMTECSSIDTDDQWSTFPGIHIIIARTGGFSFYYSLGGETWELKSKPWAGGRLRNEGKKARRKRVSFCAAGLVGEGGEENVKDLIQDKPALMQVSKASWREAYIKRYGEYFQPDNRRGGNLYWEGRDSAHPSCSHMYGTTMALDGMFPHNQGPGYEGTYPRMRPPEKHAQGDIYLDLLGTGRTGEVLCPRLVILEDGVAAMIEASSIELRRIGKPPADGIGVRSVIQGQEGRKHRLEVHIPNERQGGVWTLKGDGPPMGALFGGAAFLTSVIAECGFSESDWGLRNRTCKMLNAAATIEAQMYEYLNLATSLVLEIGHRYGTLTEDGFKVVREDLLERATEKQEVWDGVYRRMDIRLMPTNPTPAGIQILALQHIRDVVQSSKDLLWVTGKRILESEFGPSGLLKK